MSQQARIEQPDVHLPFDSQNPELLTIYIDKVFFGGPNKDGVLIRAQCFTICRIGI